MGIAVVGGRARKSRGIMAAGGRASLARSSILKSPSARANEDRAESKRRQIFKCRLRFGLQRLAEKYKMGNANSTFK
jgi:hypothetical protein